MGPIRFKEELNSAYRMRYAGYCFKWLIGLGLSFAVMLTIRPSSDAGPSQFVVFFLYIGLGLGSLAALIAMLGFLIGALWSGWIDANLAREKGWRKFKCYLAIVAGLAMTGFAFYWALHGALTGETLALSRKAIKVRYAEHELDFLFAMGFWLWAAVYGPFITWRKFIEANGI